MMNSPVLDPSDHCLQEGWIVSISQLDCLDERVARVTTSSPEETWLKLSRPDLPSLFQTGAPVRIKYWDEPSVSYWEAKVLQVPGQDNQRVAISDQSQGITLGRRRYSRLSMAVPISFRVIHAGSDVLEKPTVFSDRIRNMSAGGMSFDTALPLEVGDELEIELNLPHHPKVCVAGWIVRSSPTENGQERQQSVALEYLGLGGEEEAQLLKFLDQYQLSPGAYKLTGLYPESIVQKREDQRFEIQLMGTAILGGSNGTVEKSITTKDLSSSGGYFLTESSPRVGNNVRIRLQWPSQAEEPDTTFEVIGTVLRIEQVSEKTCGFAVEFQEIIDLDMASSDDA